MKKKLFLNSCCGPCLAYPYDALKDKYEITIYNTAPNIHPYNEYIERRDALREYTKQINLPLIEDDYDIHEWFDYIKGDENSFESLVKDKKNRCRLCYRLRLERTAKLAKEKGFELFSTTLLYSKYQYHDLIKKIGETIAEKYGLKFLYNDFRTGWQKGIDLYKPLGLYKQKYCGCIFSIEERYNKERAAV
ncbi:MAG: epoxyqueuosine reductase QueH [Elusimicrobiota bacterium]